MNTRTPGFDPKTNQTRNVTIRCSCGAVVATLSAGTVAAPMKCAACRAKS